MNIPEIDKSNYLKGLLIVAKKDNRLADSEKNILKDFAMRLGFASDFYDETIRNLLTNRYITEGMIKFSNTVIAESFVTDGLNLAFSDNQAKQEEISWLKEIAAHNGLTEDWFTNKLAAFTKPGSPVKEFALFSII